MGGNCKTWMYEIKIRWFVKDRAIFVYFVSHVEFLVPRKAADTMIFNSVQNQIRGTYDLRWYQFQWYGVEDGMHSWRAKEGEGGLSLFTSLNHMKQSWPICGETYVPFIRMHHRQTPFPADVSMHLGYYSCIGMHPGLTLQSWIQSFSSGNPYSRAQLFFLAQVPLLEVSLPGTLLEYSLF